MGAINPLLPIAVKKHLLERRHLFPAATWCDFETSPRKER